MIARLRIHFLPGALLLFLACTLAGQNPAGTQPKTAINADRSITYRLTFPGAKQVSVTTDAMLHPLPMTEDSNGVWSATTPPLTPNYYGYTFVVDGVHMLDPFNREIHPNFVDFFSDILVPGATPAPWELTNIPHGEITRHIFTTHFCLNYPNDQTAYVVYTPPGYDTTRKVAYPVLYLLHSYSGTEDDWTATGKVNLMLDQLLAEGKIVPMVVVMPRGYGDFDIVGRGVNAPVRGTGNEHSGQLFMRSLTEEVLPAVEREYNVARDREHRAIAGSSMGGGQSIEIGLAHPEFFAWIGGISAAVPGKDFDTRFPGVDAQKARLRLLWIACGTDDFLMSNDRALVAWAKEKGLPVTAFETQGWHTFAAWRNDLLALAPLLFRN